MLGGTNRPTKAIGALRYLGTMVTLHPAPGGHDQKCGFGRPGHDARGLTSRQAPLHPESKRSDSPRLNATFCQKSAGHLALNFAGTNTPCEKLAR